jgi:hypothetical protein
MKNVILALFEAEQFFLALASERLEMTGVSLIIASSLQPFDIHICFAGYVSDDDPYRNFIIKDQ